MHPKLLRLLTLLLLFPIPGRAGFIRSISTQEGLSNNSVLSIAQDPNGRIWLGTCEGLNVWNGERMDHYSTQDEGKGALSGNLIERIHFCPGLGCWVETDYGLDLLDEKGTIRQFNDFRGRYRLLSWDSPDRCIALTQAGKAWQFDGMAFLPLRTPPLPAYADILDSHSLGDRLLIFTRSGIIGASDRLRDLQVISHQSLLFADCHPDEAFVLSPEGILYRFDYAEGRLEYKTRLPEDLRSRGEIRSIVRDGEDLIVAFLFNGAVRLKYRSEQEHPFCSEPLPISCGVFDLMKDCRQDILWMATDGQGLLMAASVPFDFHQFSSERFGAFSTPIRALCKDRRGNLWIGTKGDGLVCSPAFRADENAAQRPFRTYRKELSNPAVFALRESARPLLWIGSEGQGIDYYSYRDARIHHLDGTPENLRYVHDMEEDGNGDLWLATVGEGVFHLSLEGDPAHPRIRSCRKLDLGNLRNDSEYYFCLTLDRDGRLWIGSRGCGLIHYDPFTGKAHVHTLDGTGSSASNDIWDILLDRSGRLWAATGGGLFRLNGNRMVGTSVSSLIHQISEDRSGNLWLSTNNGLIRYSPQNRYAQRFGHSYGLQTLEYADGASFTDREGRLYFGGTGGFTVVEAPEGNTSPVHPDLALLSLRRGGRIFPLFYPLKRPEIKLESGEHLDGVEISVLDYIDGENYNYQYRIPRLSEKWTESRGYLPLPPLTYGDYTLEMRYVHPENNLKGPVSILTIHVPTPPWMSGWAIVFYLMLLGGLIYALVRLIRHLSEKEYRKRLARLEALQREEMHSSQLKLLRDFATQIERPSLMLAAPIHQILHYGRADEYVTACAENARHYSDKINHTLQLFQELTGDERPLPEIVLFSPKDSLTQLMDTYSDIARTRKFVFEYDIPSTLVWVGSPRTLIMVSDMMLTNLFYHQEEGGRIFLSVRQMPNQLRLDIGTDGLWPDVNLARRMLDPQLALEYIQNHLQQSLTIQDEMRLAVCHSLLGKIGGTIDVRREGDECRFTIDFPRMELDKESEGLPASMSEQDEEEYMPSASLLLKTELPDSPLPGPDLKTMFSLSTHSDITDAITLLFQSDFNIRLFQQAEEIEEELGRSHPDILLCEALDGAPQTERLVRSLKANPETARIPLILISREQRDWPADSWITLPLNAKSLKYTVEQNLRRMESLKNYFSSSVGLYEFSDGRKLHHEDKEFLEKLYRVIRSNLQKPGLTTRHIAEEMNMSLRKLYSRMDGVVNVTPSNIIREYRLAYAAQALLKTKLTTAEIIWQAGFSNRGTFFKNFQARYGCTPKEYREKNS